MKQRTTMWSLIFRFAFLTALLAGFTSVTHFAAGELSRAQETKKLEIVSKTPNAVEAVRALTGGHGAEVVIEAVGKPETWHWAVNMLAKGGTVNFFGGCPADTKVSLDTNLLHYSEISCKASFHHTPELMQKALDHITSGDITASSFVNREEPLIRLPEVMQHLMSHNGHLKTAILP